MFALVCFIKTFSLLWYSKCLGGIFVHVLLLPLHITGKIYREAIYCAETSGGWKVYKPDGGICSAFKSAFLCDYTMLKRITCQIRKRVLAWALSYIVTTAIVG